ncbi:MAG: clan AA aspartic protease [Gammaproteobacteria bacterium]
MGIITDILTLKNPRLPHLRVMEARALVDSGCTYLCIPESVRVELGLEINESKPVFLADGSQKFVPYVGPIEVRFKDRVAFCGALVMGDQVLLGAVPMEDMDLVIVPRTQTLDVNPVCGARV